MARPPGPQAQRLFARSKDHRWVFQDQAQGGVVVVNGAPFLEYTVQRVSMNAADSNAKRQTVVEVVDEVTLRMTLAQALATARWIEQHVEEHERATGQKVPEPDLPKAGAEPPPETATAVPGYQ
ncbi:MAG: hypothetical protein QXO51_00935 [Halobacteria archaeon]